MALPKGSRAPDFELKSKNDEGLVDIKLSDSVGRQPTVLLFFPLAFAPPCQTEMCAMRDSLKEYEALNAAVYGISVDSPFAQEAFAKANDLNFPLLSDFNKEVTTAYDVLYEDLLGLKGVSKRSIFVIDKEGTIIFSSSNEDPFEQPNLEEIKAVLAS